jgi:hypothetical protein
MQGSLQSPHRSARGPEVVLCGAVPQPFDQPCLGVGDQRRLHREAEEVLGHYSVVVTERYAHLRVDLFAERNPPAIPLTLGTRTARVVEITQQLPSSPRKAGRKRLKS